MHHALLLVGRFPTIPCAKTEKPLVQIDFCKALSIASFSSLNRAFPDNSVRKTLVSCAGDRLRVGASDPGCPIVEKGSMYTAELMTFPASAPQLVYQRPWNVLLCLCSSAYKRSLVTLRKKQGIVSRWQVSFYLVLNRINVHLLDLNTIKYKINMWPVCIAFEQLFEISLSMDFSCSEFPYLVRSSKKSSYI